jgi:hypothetical protein
VVGEFGAGRSRRFAIDQHLNLTFLGPQRDRLLAEPADHVERALRLPAQRQFLNVLRDPALNDRPQFLGNREEPIRRTQALEGLMRALVVVILHPQPNPLPRLVEAVKLGPTEKLFPDRLPEPLHLAQRHRVMRLALEVMHSIFRQLLLEPRLAPPTRVLPAIVSEHLLRHAILADRRAIHLQHVFGTLAAEHIEAHHIARVIIQKRHQVGVLAAQPKREDVALPHLIGRAALKEPRLRWVLRRLLLGLGQQPMLM